LTPHSFYVFLPILSYFISHYFLLIRRRWIAEIMLWVFLGGIVFVGMMARYQRFSSVNYSALLSSPKRSDIEEGKKVMVLGNDNEVYFNHQMAGYFLNWNLSKEVFEEADYFENIITIQKAFQTDPPDVIIDERGLMRNVMERIPSLKRKYKQEGHKYIKISN
jgi:hypothetical protein